MASIRVNSLTVGNYRSFGETQTFRFPSSDYRKPISIVGYNNTGKTNLLNAIKFGLYESVREDTFSIQDFHNKNWSLPPSFELSFEADIDDDRIRPGNEYVNTVVVRSDGTRVTSVSDTCNCYPQTHFSKKWPIKQKAPIFFVNFHTIKEEISTNRTSWGNLRSFLAKHIQSIVESDDIMVQRKVTFETEVKAATDNVINGSSLQTFIALIQKNYSENLRKNNCVVEFGLPSYEDIFLKMLFKIGLNGSESNLVPLDHFGDGFISMFVMAVIQAIAEYNNDDQCLFLFEEPESFLHENHQEYFYKMVLCGLTERGHQVIYTTHSDKMIDPFDTRGLIRLELDQDGQTIRKYNNVQPLMVEFTDEESGEVINMSRYNEFIKSVEPNLNLMLFSSKVILVEGPNDFLVYKHAIKSKVRQLVDRNETIVDKEKFADTYLSFENIAIICHYGKITALYLIELCRHFNVDFFVVNDWDIEEPMDLAPRLLTYTDERFYKRSADYIQAINKSMMTVNWKLIRSAGIERIHFNCRRLEEVIGYEEDDKDSLKIWNHINSANFIVDERLIPVDLFNFLGLEKLLFEMDTVEVPVNPMDLV